MPDAAAEHPVIFSAPMVRALLAGEKSQTRRLARSPLARAVPGDRLWVRENCRAEELDDGRDGVRYAADGAWRPIENTPEAGEAWVALFHYRGRGTGRVGNPVPSIHMPRWASRLALTVRRVRRQRLHDITTGDASAEAPHHAFALPPYDDGSGIDPRLHVSAFAALWDRLHQGDVAWEANPEVVALTFSVEVADA